MPHMLQSLPCLSVYSMDFVYNVDGLQARLWRLLEVLCWNNQHSPRERTEVAIIWSSGVRLNVIVHVGVPVHAIATSMSLTAADFIEGSSLGRCRSMAFWIRAHSARWYWCKWDCMIEVMMPFWGLYKSISIACWCGLCGCNVCKSTKLCWSMDNLNTQCHVCTYVYSSLL